MIMRGSASAYLSLSVIALFILVAGCTGSGQPAPTPTPSPIAVATANPASSTPTYEISGTVRDYMGLPVYNAKVTIWQGSTVLNIPNNPQLSSSSGDVLTTGQYDFKHVPQGNYTITAELNDESGSISYPASGLTDIFIRSPTATPLPTVAATARPVTSVYNVNFVIGRASDRDIIITNTGGSDVAKLQSVMISFTDNQSNVRGPGLSSDMSQLGVTGDLNKNVGSMCDIDSRLAASPSHVTVYGIFNDGTMQVVATADA